MTASDYMGKADRALSAAQLLLASGDTEAACNRAYYAMFDAAHAGLINAVEQATSFVALIRERLVSR